MSSLGIQFTGLASGLDTRSLIDAIVAAERAPLQSLSLRRQDLLDQGSSISRLDSLLTDLRTALNGLRQGSTALALSATSSQSDAFTARVDSTASVGNHSISISQLATSQSNASMGYSSPDASLGTGSLEIYVGTDKTQLDFTDATLQDVADAIDGIEGLSASIVNTGTGDSPYQLLVRADETGSSNTVTFTALSGMELTTLAGGLSANQLTAAQDAKLVIDGLTITSSSNTVENTIPGVTLELTDETSGDATLTIARDTAQIGTRLQEFVDAYNAVVSEIESVTDRSEDGVTGRLFGDSLVRGIRLGMRGIVGRAFSGLSGSFSLLSELGIDSDVAGRLSLDTSKLESALASDPEGFDALITDTNGLIETLGVQIDSWTQSGGLIDNRGDSLDDRVEALERRISRGDDRLASLEARLVDRFAGLETLLAQLQQQGSALSGLNSLGTTPR